MLIPSGTRLTYVAQFDASYWSQNGTDLISSVSNALSNNWGIIIETSSLQWASNLDYLGGVPNGCSLGLLNNNDHGNGTDGTEDIRSIVDHEIYNVLGSMPTASRITDYTLPGLTSSTNTGAAPPPQGGATSSQAPASQSSTTIEQQISDALKKMQDSLPSLGTVTWVAIVGAIALGGLFIFLHEA